MIMRLALQSLRNRWVTALLTVLAINMIGDAIGDAVAGTDGSPARKAA